MSYLAKARAFEVKREAERGGQEQAPAEVNDPDLASRLLSMDCETFKAAQATVEVNVPWDTKPIWFVSDESLVAMLTEEGVSRGRVWTANELMDLLAIPGITTEKVKTIARVRRIFEGTIDR